MGLEEAELNRLAHQTVVALAARSETLAVCESLTAGLAASSIAEVPGASEVFRGGLVTYATDLKATLAGVDKQLLERVGPIDPETARQMAEGVRRICGSDWGVAFTGVAGPTEQDGHPVGEVYIAVAGPDGTETLRALRDGHVRTVDGIDVLEGDRDQIRRWAVEAGLLALLDRKND